ncbi:MAG: hypothetical protein HFH06_14630 [Lachnospiraceae bacterium]|nr:hypothetical protein [Lachnospiraceae bacterium]
MLGKLLKHEWKSTWKVGGMMLLGLLLVSFFGWFSFQAPVWQSMSDNGYYNGFTLWDLMSVGVLLLYVIMLIGLNYGIMIYIGVHFYKTMYTDEGYLTHTLPVSKHEILVSKILIGGLWMLLVTIGVFLSVMGLVSSMFGAVMPEGYSWRELWDEMQPYMGYMDDMFKDTFGMSITSYFILLAVMSVVQPFCTITILFGAISIGQLFTKHRVLMAIVSYVGIMIVANMLSSMVQGAFSINQMARSLDDNAMLGRYMNVSLYFSVFLSIVEAIILYIVSHQITTKKLNME